MKKQTKQSRKKIISIFLLLIAIPIYIFTNLSWNRIYYYTHSQKTDKKLTPIVVIYNLGDIMTKPKRESDGKYHYTVPGNIIRYEQDENIALTYRNGEGIRRLHSSFSILDNKNETSISYHLSPELKITNIVEFLPDKIHNIQEKPGDQEMVDKYIRQLTDHVIETRVTPPLFFNLQWLYDLTFDEKKVYHVEDY